MAKLNSAYNYGTSPRKLQPEYTPNTKKKTKVNKKPNNQKEKIQKEKEKQKIEEQARKKHQRKMIICIGIGFIILFAISYRNSKIDEGFSKIQKLKNQLSIIQKENEQLQVSIENGSNLNNLEQSAKEMLGMQKLTNKQSVYVNLPKVDYIEEAN